MGRRMKQSPLSTRLVFSLCLLINIFCAAGYNDSLDAGASIATAEAILERGSTRILTLAPHNHRLLAKGREGYYSKLGLTHPVLYVPAVAAGRLVASWRGEEKRWVEFFVSMLNPIFHALLVAVLFWFFSQQKVPPRRALLLAGLTGYSTLLLPYAKSFHREMLQALLLTVLLLVSFKGKKLETLECLGCGLLLSAIVHIKAGLFVTLIPVLIFLILQLRTRPFRYLFSLLFPLVVSLAFLAVYWKVIVGAESVTGYGPRVMSPSNAKAWSTPFWEGVYTQLLSPASGLLWYSPIIVVAIFLFAARGVQKNWTTFDKVLIATILFHVGLHSKWFDAAGVGPLGPRYIVAIIPLFALLCLQLPRMPVAPIAKLGKVTAALLLAWSVSLQIVFVCVKPQIYEAIIHGGAPVPRKSYEPQWIALNRIFIHKVQGKPEVYSTALFSSASPPRSVDLGPHRSLHGFNFWWARVLHAEESL